VKKNNLNRKELSQRCSEKLGLPYSISNKLIDDLIELIIKEINKGNFGLKNIGTFKLIYKKERLGRNPKTGENFLISKRNSISFKPSINLTKSINR